MSDDDPHPKRSARLAAKRNPDDSATDKANPKTDKKAGKKADKKADKKPDKKAEKKAKKPSKKAMKQIGIDQVAQLENEAAQEEEEAAAARRGASNRRHTRRREPSPEDDAEAEPQDEIYSHDDPPTPYYNPEPSSQDESVNEPTPRTRKGKAPAKHIQRRTHISDSDDPMGSDDASTGNNDVEDPADDDEAPVDDDEPPVDDDDAPEDDDDDVEMDAETEKAVRKAALKMDIGDDDPCELYTPEMASHFRKVLKASSKKQAAPCDSEDDVMDVDDDNAEATPKPTKPAPQKRVTGRAAVEQARSRMSEQVNEAKRKNAPSLPNTPRKPRAGKKSKVAPPSPEQSDTESLPPPPPPPRPRPRPRPRPANKKGQPSNSQSDGSRMASPSIEAESHPPSSPPHPPRRSTTSGDSASQRPSAPPPSRASSSSRPAKPQAGPSQSKQPAAPSKQSAAPSKKPPAPSKQPAAPSKQSAAPSKQSAASSKQSAAPSKQPAASSKQPVAPLHAKAGVGGLKASTSKPTSSSSRARSTSGAPSTSRGRSTSTAPSTTQGRSQSRAPSTSQAPSGAPSRATSMSRARSTSRAPSTSKRTQDDVQEEEGMRYGGLEDEDETCEQDDVDKQDHSKLVVPTRNEFFTRITPLTSNDGATIKPKRKKFTNKHIPEPLRSRFASHLLPLARELAGTLPPWTLLSLEQKQSLVNRVWPEYGYSVRTNDVVYDLLDFRLSDWYADFRKTALAVVSRHFEKNDSPDARVFADREGRAAFCQSELKDGDDRDLPLVFADYDAQTGRFENPWILEIFGIVHYSVVSEIPEGERSKDRPLGSLILAKLALEFALTHWRTGELRIPDGAPGFFSKDNWGNTTVFERGGVTKSVKKGTFFVKTVQGFKDAKWQTILDQGKEWWLSSRSRGEGEGVAAGAGWHDEDDDADDDFVLESG